jgi:uncharacterized membrane protein YcfT
VSEAVTAAVLYLSAGALAAGTIRSVRSSVEHKSRDRFGIALAATGAIGLIIAIVAFAHGPRTVLPF